MKSEQDLTQWQQEVKNLATDSFCVLPWIHVSTRTNGDMRVCCVANSAGSVSGDTAPGTLKDHRGQPLNLADHTMDQAWNQSYLKQIRTTMLGGQRPASCQRCYREEAAGMVSKRLWETLHWHKKGTDISELIQNTSSDGSTSSKVKYLDLRLGNTCNLGCIMCSGHDSSYWLRDHRKTYDLFTLEAIKQERRYHPRPSRWWLEDSFWLAVEEKIPYLEEIAFAGGEPLLIAQHRRLLEKIIDQGRSGDIALRYTTNGTVLDDELLALWQQFRDVKITVSMDALGRRLEYIRWPIDEQLLLANLDRLDATGPNISVNLAVTVQNLNILHIADMIQWKVQRNYRKINRGINETGWEAGGGLFIANVLWRPQWFNVQNLSRELKDAVTERFRDLEQWLAENHSSPGFWQENPYAWRRWQSILSVMQSQAADHQKEFKEYIEVMDQQRGTDFKSVFPELSSWI